MLEKSELRLVRGGLGDQEYDPAGAEVDMASYEKHTLPTDSESLTDIEVVTILAGSHGQGENKDLVMHARPIDGSIWYIVLDHQKEVFRGSAFIEAIEAYNKV